MTTVHRIYITLLALITVLTIILLGYYGFSYYHLPLEERFFHESHNLLKPGGTWGHGLGIVGSVAMILGILLYMARKRMRSLSRLGLLRHWLEFHIFLCTLGPALILFHTSFKFGGLVALSFWSMVAVFLSGIIGRFIYIQIPRTIEGRELRLNEVREMISNIGTILTSSYRLDEESFNRNNIRKIRAVLRKNGLSRAESRKVIHLVHQEISLNRRIDRLMTMQKLFRYWHIAHLPFAMVMLIIMVIHVVVTIIFGYRWIF